MPVYYEQKSNFLSMVSDTPWAIHWLHEEEIDYVLPSSVQQGAPNKLALPTAYIALFAAYYHFATKSTGTTDPHTPRGIDIPSFPQLQCRLDYVDVGELSIDMEPIIISDDTFSFDVRCSRPR